MLLHESEMLKSGILHLILSLFNCRLVLKEEASDYLELETIKNLVKKYSQFINFPIYVWASKVTTLSFPSTL